MNREELGAFVAENLTTMGEDEAIAVLSNRSCTPPICVAIAGNSRLASYYEVKLRLVTCRATPQHLSMKFVRHLYRADLVRCSTDVQLVPPIRAAMEAQLLAVLPKLAIGERISMAKVCSREIGKALIGDADLRVFAALLNNARLREEDLVLFAQSERATAGHLNQLANHVKWRVRYGVRRAIAFSANAPRALAASELRHLRRDDREALYRNPATSVYLRRCLETMVELARPDEEETTSEDAGQAGIGYNGGSNE